MALDDPVVITCAISGALADREQCPAIPYTPAEYAAEARRIVDEGGVHIHVHARKPDTGRPSVDVEDFAAISEAIRAEVGDAAIVNFSTGTVGVDVATRVAYLEACRPEVAALNMGSMNYAKYSASRKAFVFDMVFANPFGEILELLEAMVHLGIKPEHECFDLGHVGSLTPLVDMGALPAPLHADFVMGVTGGVPARARNLQAMADELAHVPGGPHHWGVIGIGRVQWTMLAAALSLGGSVRAGLEDNLYLPDGSMARSNGDLIAKAREMTVDAGRRPATVQEARALLGVPQRTGGGRVSALPLEGLRVLDLSRLLPGPFCSLLLADYGADVIKVEDTGMGDYVRWSVPKVEGVEESAAAARFLALNRGKRSIRLDLKTDDGRDAFLKLVETADVVLESFRPGVMDRLGVGYEALRARNSRVVLASISGYGQDGPLRDRAGHDLNYLGRVGLLALSGDAEAPVQAAGQIADLGGGALMAAFGIMVALRERERSGEGQHVDVSMADGALSWLAMDAARALQGDDLRRGDMELGGRFVCYRPYPCADGWVTVGALEPKFWAAFCAGVGREDLVGVQFDAPGSAGHAAVAEVIASRTRAEWAAFADEHDCCVEPVLELGEALESDLVRKRGMVATLDQHGVAVPLLGAPVGLSRTPADPSRARPAPSIGEHTAELLAEVGVELPEGDAATPGSFLS